MKIKEPINTTPDYGLVTLLMEYADRYGYSIRECDNCGITYLLDDRYKKNICITCNPDAKTSKKNYWKEYRRRLKCKQQNPYQKTQ